MSLFGNSWKKDSGGAEKTPAGRWRVGDRIGSRLEVTQILGGEGKSGMGIVYICSHSENQKIYALKTFQERYLLSEEANGFFQKEALVWTELENHPNIVRAYCVFSLEERLFILLEYIAPDSRGRNTLTHYLGNLSFPEILKFSIQFCYGMEYAYSKGIDAHRDIKPDNIMLTEDRTVKITDWGFVRVAEKMQLEKDIISLGEKSGLSIFQSKEGKRVCGTLPYMAPEQFDGYADKKSDIYGFGITLYQMVTNGGLPFVGRTQEEYEKMHKYGKVPLVSSPLSSLIQKCLEKDPSKRYRDFSAVREELQRLLLKETGETVAAPEISELRGEELAAKGFALVNLGKYQEAITCYDKAIEAEPGSVMVWQGKGLVLEILGKYQEAITCYDKVLEIEPDHTQAQQRKKDCCQSLLSGKTEEKVICPGDSRSEVEELSNKAIILTKRRRYEEALDCYGRILEIEPGFAYFWSRKGAFLSFLRRHEEAIACLDKAIEIEPGMSEAYKIKMGVLLRLGKIPEASKCCEELLRLNPNSLWYRLVKSVLGDGSDQTVAETISFLVKKVFRG